MPIASWDLSADKGLEVPQLVSIRKPRVAVGTRISPRPPHRSRRALLTHMLTILLFFNRRADGARPVHSIRSRRALLTHRAPPSGQTSCDERFSYARRPTRSHYSDRRGISAQCPNRGRLTAVPLGCGPSLHDFRRELPPVCTENLIRVDAVMESPKLAE
jgi:hypothetical protein